MTPAFPSPQARATDPTTSHEAAALTAPRASAGRLKAAAALIDRPNGLTDFELGDLVGLQQTSCGKRRFELMEAGLVEDAGIKRSTPSGAMAKVWRITDEGRAWYAEWNDRPTLWLVEAPETVESGEAQDEEPAADSGKHRPRSDRKRPIHPAQYPVYLVDVIAKELRRHVPNLYTAGQWSYLLDPFAGLGYRLAEIAAAAGMSPYGVEIEPAYVKNAHRCVSLGDATCLNFFDESIDAWSTSPTYPSGVNDDFHARDNSKRNTYIHRIREHEGESYELAENSTARHGIRGGAKSIARYCELHGKALDELARVLKVGGIGVLNAKDVLAGGDIAFATAPWFVSQLEARGFEVVAWQLIDAPGLRQGANAGIRRTFEDVVTLRKVSK